MSRNGAAMSTSAHSDCGIMWVCMRSLSRKETASTMCGIWESRQRARGNTVHTDRRFKQEL